MSEKEERVVVGARVPSPLESKLDAFEEDEGLNRTEAVTRLLSDQLIALGYGARLPSDTLLKRLASELSRAAGWGMAILVGLNWGMDVDLTSFIVGFAVFLVAMVGVTHFEPRISETLGLVTHETTRDDDDGGVSA